MIDAKLELVLIKNIKNAGNGIIPFVVGHAYDLGSNAFYGRFPLINIPLSTKYTDKAWGVLISPDTNGKFNDDTASLSPGFIYVINIYPEEHLQNMSVNDQVDTTLYEDIGEWVYVAKTDNFVIKYNDDAIVLGNKTNNIIINKDGIILNGSLIKNAKEKANFFENNDIGQVAPFMGDPSTSLFPKLPTAPLETTKLISYLGNFGGLV